MKTPMNELIDKAIAYSRELSTKGRLYESIAVDHIIDLAESMLEKEEEETAFDLFSVSGSVIDVLKEMAECPNTVDSATVPKAGIEAAPEQVVVNLSVNYTKYKRLLEVVKHYR